MLRRPCGIPVITAGGRLFQARCSVITVVTVFRPRATADSPFPEHGYDRDHRRAREPSDSQVAKWRSEIAGWFFDKLRNVPQPDALASWMTLRHPGGFLDIATGGRLFRTRGSVTGQL